MFKLKFSAVSEGRDNNFDFLRFLFAALVIFSHSYGFLPVLHGTLVDGEDPLGHVSRGQIAFGGFCVDCFFLLSGFLVTKSWMSSRSLGDFAKKRALRIFPGLGVVLVFCTFVIGPLCTTELASYFHQKLTYAYLFFMLRGSLHVADHLPGVFVHNPWPVRVNGSLWTIRYELICYALVATLGCLRVYRRPLIVLALGVLLLSLNGGRLASLHSSQALADFLQTFSYFVLGMLMCLYRDRIPYSHLLLLVSVASLLAFDLIGELRLVLPVATAYTVFYVAFCKRLPLQKFARAGDFSYGLYLYAFPIQQTLVYFYGPHLSPVTLTLAAFPLTLALAVLSWNFVEKPCLKLKPGASRLAGRLPWRSARPAAIAETELSGTPR